MTIKYQSLKETQTHLNTKRSGGIKFSSSQTRPSNSCKCLQTSCSGYSNNKWLVANSNPSNNTKCFCICIKGARSTRAFQRILQHMESFFSHKFLQPDNGKIGQQTNWKTKCKDLIIIYYVHYFENPRTSLPFLDNHSVQTRDSRPTCYVVK